MRTSMAYFAGAGTVVAAIAVGLGGGFVIAGVMNPNAKHELSKVELQAKAQPSPQSGTAQPCPQPSPSPSTASNAPPQTPAPYLAQVQPAANAPVVVGTASKNQPQSQKQDEAADASPVAKTNDPSPKREDVAAAKRNNTAKSKRDDAATAKRDDEPKARQAEQTPSQPATHDEASSSESAYAKAGDADLKRQDDRRKGRHQQWVARHQQQRDHEMRDVEEQVRRDPGPREVIVRRDDSDRADFDRSDDDRPDYGRPTGFGFPHINLFGSDD